MNKTVRWGLTVGAALLLREALARLEEADLHEQAAIVTGGSRGFGLALARELAAQGCKLALLARDADELERAKALLEKEGATVFAVPCDVSVQAEAEHAVRTVAEHYGHIDILVNNAGVIGVGPVQNMDAGDFQQAMGTNFFGTLYPTLAALPSLKGHGRILNITSIGGKVSVPHLLPYSCAKFAQTALSEGMRAELARDGIQVTTVAPGLMRTGSFLHAEFKGQQEKEYAWFSIGDNIPGQSIGAARAARQAVRALRRGEAERVLTLPAWLAARFAGLMPSLTSDISRWVNRALPAASDDGNVVKTGAEVRAEHGQPGALIVDSLGMTAARALNE